MKKVIFLLGFLLFICALPIHAQYTSFPDATADFEVDGDDAREVGRTFNATGLPGFTFGDLAKDGKVNALDFGYIANSWNRTLTNWWPMELGNYWIYEVTEFDRNQFILWEQNFQGFRTGVTARNCNPPYDTYKDFVLGSKVATEVIPSMGYNRFNTTRFVQYYKESKAAYHAPQYCNLVYGQQAVNNWNLQWFTHNPVFFNNQFWYGSEGGVRFYRDPALLEGFSQVSPFGVFPKNGGLHYGGGRVPATDSLWSGLPGYTYIPLSLLPDQVNTSAGVVPDIHYEFGGGSLSNNQDFRTGISSYLNDSQVNKLVWELEYIPLKASDVLTKNLLPGNTDILSIIFFEPLYRDLNQTQLPVNEEIACENYYLARDIGLVKVTHNIVSVLPNDPDLQKTRQVCFWLFKDDFSHSTDAQKRATGFSLLNPNLSDLALFKYTYPKNSFEIINYKLYSNPSETALGFHSPAASFVGSPVPTAIEYFANGRFWNFTLDGTLTVQGSLVDAWGNRGIQGHLINGVTIYPWTNMGPDEVENGDDIQTVFGATGIVINDGVYWLRNAGTTQPFAAPSGYVRDLLPGYAQRFGDNTDNLGIAGTGFNQVFFTKDGQYLYYGKDTSGNVSLALSGFNNTLPLWVNAPKISGFAPLRPDSMMYGPMFNQTYNTSPSQASNPIPTDKQLIIFQKGAAWVKYGYSGPWEDWAGQLK